MKLLGVLLVLLTGVAAGFFRVRRLRQRTEHLAAFRDFLLYLRTNIAFTSRSLQELVAKNRENPFGICFAKHLEKEIEPLAFRKSAEEFLFQQEDISAAQSLIAEFGRADLQSQLASLSMGIAFFDTHLAQLRESYHEKCKVTLMLSTFTSAAVALVLM